MMTTMNSITNNNKKKNIIIIKTKRNNFFLNVLFLSVLLVSLPKNCHGQGILTRLGSTIACFVFSNLCK